MIETAEMILTCSGRGGKTKALKEMLKGKKVVFVKDNYKNYEKTLKKEENYYRELEKKTICFSEEVVFKDKKLKKLFQKLTKLHKKNLQKLSKVYLITIEGKFNWRDYIND